jgi:RNA 2',3'-cyclic 3'-phosphodiesterase
LKTDANAIEAKKLRAFIALKTPASWDEQLAKLQTELRSTLEGLDMAWVKPEQLHVTLRFFGHIVPSALEEIRSLAAPICSSIQTFRASCHGIGVFPSVKRPRVIWAGIVHGSAEMRELQTRLTASTTSIGQPPEDRPFQPHLTLGRIKYLDRKLQRQFESSVEKEFRIEEPWIIDEVLLMRSNLSPHGARYECLHAWPLGR